MNTPRSNLGVVAVDGKIYAIGGYESVDVHDGTILSFVDTNECYDPTADTWATLKPMPTPRGNFIIVTCQGKIYCIGGADGTIYPLGPPVFRPLDVVEVYDPIIDMWESRTSCPINVQQDMQAQVVNDLIFIITSKGELYMYKPLLDKWSTKTSLPTEEKPMQTLVINEQLFVITQSAMYMYDPVTSSWRNKTNMPTSMNYAFSDVIDNKIIVGDFLLVPSTETIWRGLFNAQLRVRFYDPLSDVWHEGKTTDEHIFATNPIFNGTKVIVTSGVYAPKNIYVLGIEATKGDLMNVKPFTWVYEPVGDVWSTAKVVDTTPYIREYTMVVIDDVFYIVGSVFNVKYVPVGYNSLGYQVPSTDVFDSSFILKVTGVLVLTIGTVTVCSYYFINRKRNK
jgi:hypothetical protein